MYKEWNQAGGKLSKGGFDFLPSMFYFCDPQSLPASSEEILHAAMGSSPLCNPQYLSLKRVSLVFYNMYQPPATAIQPHCNLDRIYNSQPLLTQYERWQSSCLWCGRLSLSWMPNHPPAHLLMYLICISFFDISLIIFARNLCSAVLDKLWVL